MPASETRREEGEENSYGSARPRKAQQEHGHSKPRRRVQADTCDHGSAGRDGGELRACGSPGAWTEHKGDVQDGHGG